MMSTVTDKSDVQNVGPLEIALDDDGERSANISSLSCDSNVVENQTTENTGMQGISSNSSRSSGQDQNKVILCQDGQLLLSFTPAFDRRGQLFLLKGNVPMNNPSTGEQPKIIINLNSSQASMSVATASSTGTAQNAAQKSALPNQANANTVNNTLSYTKPNHLNQNTPSPGAHTSSTSPPQTKSDSNEPNGSSRTESEQPDTDMSSGDSIYVCSVKGCGRSFPSMSLLTCHQTLHKTTSNKKTDLTCEICKLKFAWPSHYKYHLLTHNNERAYQCYVNGCGKRFYTMQRLDVHLRSHTGVRPFTCDHEGCGKSFTTKGNLRNHQRVHTGEKPYKCSYMGCASAFAEFSSLRKHRLVHSGEKPFACDFCDKVFSQSGSRNIHMNKNHAARKQHTLTISNTQSVTAETAVGATIDSAMMVESPQNILVLTHYDDKMLHYQESLQAEVEGLGSRSNVVVLSQPEELVNMGETYQSATHEEIVYDNDILNSDLDQDQIASTSLSIQQDLENESNESQASSDQMMVSILDASSSSIKPGSILS